MVISSQTVTGGVIALALSITACSMMSSVSRTGTVREISITPTSVELKTTAQKGDEIRWVNHQDGPVQVVFLDSIEDKVECQQGFGLLGVANGATVSAHRSASLCFSKPGVLRYTLRMDRALPTGELNLLGQINVMDDGQRM